MSQDHKDCDLLFASAENAVNRGDWESATQAFDEFIKAMDRHLGIEEEKLFPAFEEETGMKNGPTEMMRLEHEQMRQLFSEMRDALTSQDLNEYLGTAETLLILMQQHNMKEEQILYNMMDQRLPQIASHWQQMFEHWNKH